jgi:outer membrane protein assembly factor BamB
VSGKAIFLTAVRETRLETLRLDLDSGAIVWRREVVPILLPPPADGTPASWKVRNPDDSGRPATPTPVTDGERVFVYFGAFGLLAYDLDGNELWRRVLEVPDPEAAASPILVGNRLIVVCDRESNSFVEARDKGTGHLLWRTPRGGFRRSRSTPFHRHLAGKEEVVVNGSLWLAAYRVEDGVESWRFPGLARIATSSPTASGDLVFAAGSAAGDDLGPEPEPDDPAPLGSSWSLDLSGGATSATAAPPPKPGEGIFAVRPEGDAKVPRPGLAWKSTRGAPYASSPLAYRGRLFTVKAGGLVSAYDPESGRQFYHNERLSGAADHYASPVAAAGRVYFTSQMGTISVVAASSDSPELLQRIELGEPVLATPALAGRHMVVRTSRALHALTTRP